MARRWLPLILLSLTLSLAVPIAYGGRDSITALMRMQPWIVGLAIVVVMLAWLLNGSRLAVLTGGLGHRLRVRTGMLTVLATDFATLATPGGSGGPPTTICLLSRRGIRPSTSAGIVAADHMMDVVFFALSLPLVLLFCTMPQNSPLAGLTRLMSAVAVISLLLAIALWRGRGTVMRIVLGGLRRMPRVCDRRYRAMARAMARFNRSLHLLWAMGPHRWMLACVCCAGHWLLHYSVLFILLWCLGISISWGYLFLAQGLALLAGRVTFLPGGGGGVELGLAVLLHPYLDAPTTGLVLLTWRFVTYYWYALLGMVVFLWMSRKVPSSLRAYLQRDS